MFDFLQVVNKHRSSKLLSFWKNRDFAFWRQDPKWRISAILDFRGPITGSLKSPGTTSYRSSTETIALNCLIFLENRVFCILTTDRQTNKHIIIIIINEKINVAFSRRTERTRNSHKKNTSRENVVSNSTEEEKIVMKMTARRAVSSAYGQHVCTKPLSLSRAAA